MLITEESVKKKIKFYHDLFGLISIGSTITEFAILENALERVVQVASRIGLDIIEVGENSIQLPIEQKTQITDTIKSGGLEFNWKVGKKDPRHQPGIDNILHTTDDGIKLGSKKIVMEANEGINVGIYDEKGLIKWSFIGAITTEYPP